MVPERRVLHEELNAFHRIAAKETWVIIIVKVVWNSQTIVTDFARFSTVDADCVGHFIQPFKSSVGRG